MRQSGYSFPSSIASSSNPHFVHRTRPSDRGPPSGRGATSPVRFITPSPHFGHLEFTRIISKSPDLTRSSQCYYHQFKDKNRFERPYSFGKPKKKSRITRGFLFYSLSALTGIPLTGLLCTRRSAQRKHTAKEVDASPFTKQSVI
jgi:hypothetical protein